MVTGRLLGKLNALRNSLEHEFAIPSAEDAETFVDVVELFLAATDRLMFNFPTQIEFEVTNQLSPKTESGSPML